LAHDTRPDLILKLFLRVWNLKLPRLVISIDGGIADFELQPKLKRVLKKGLLRAAKTTGSWIITNGCQQGTQNVRSTLSLLLSSICQKFPGIVKHVGDALFVRSPKAKSDIVCIGFAPWGVIEGRENFIGINVRTDEYA
jgi:transient receptor potential cation channel subfamily M member 3